MPSQIDHVVVVVRNLDIASEGVRKAGFTVTPGGEHAGGHTHNALIPFRDGSYVELIAFMQPDETSTHKWWERLWKGGGLVDYALLSANVAEEVAAVHTRGVTYPEPIDQGRLRPDGQRIAWRSSSPQTTVGESGWPFLIEDDTPRSLRVPYEESEVTHANGSTGIAGVTVVVRDHGESTTAFEAILDTTSREIDPPYPGIRQASRLAIGNELGQWIALVEPETERASDADEASVPARYLEKYGQGPFTVTLRRDESDIAPGSGKLLDLEQMSTARFYLP